MYEHQHLNVISFGFQIRVGNLHFQYQRPCQDMALRILLSSAPRINKFLSGTLSFMMSEKFFFVSLKFEKSEQAGDCFLFLREYADAIFVSITTTDVTLHALFLG